MSEPHTWGDERFSCIRTPPVSSATPVLSSRLLGHTTLPLDCHDLFFQDWLNFTITLLVLRHLCLEAAAANTSCAGGDGDGDGDGGIQCFLTDGGITAVGCGGRNVSSSKLETLNLSACKQEWKHHG